MIQAWLAKKGAQLWAWLAAIGAAIAVVFGFYEYAKKAGISGEREKQNAKEVDRIDHEAARKVENAQAGAAKEVTAIQGAKDETDKVNRLDDDAVNRKLHNEWSRD